MVKEKNQKQAQKENREKDDCPLCGISEETLAKLREADKNKKLKQNQN